MKTLALFAFAFAALSGSLAFAGGGLPRSSPEAQGVSSAAGLAFVEAADKDLDAMNSFMLVRHGHVVAEGWWSPYDAGAPHSLYSLSKSFTSTAVGLAVAEGMLSIDAEVLKFFPDDAPASPSDNLKSMRVSDLLRMSTKGTRSSPNARPTSPGRKPSSPQPVQLLSSRAPTSFTTRRRRTCSRPSSRRPPGATLLDYFEGRACSTRSGSSVRPGRPVPRASRRAVTASASAPRTSRNSASFTCSRANGRASRSSPPRG